MTKTSLVDTKELSNKIAHNPSILLDALDLDYKETGSKVHLACPIHGGDNPGACVINLHANEVVTWCCYTHHCESAGKSIFKFVQALLEVSYGDAIKYIDSLYKEEEVVSAPKKQQVKKVKIPKCVYPSNYFLERGFRKETLERYQVGLCIDKNHNMRSRHICPIFDSKGIKCIGLSGRTTHPKCPKCGGYHNPKYDCPDYYIPKWKFSDGISTNNIMYNYHLAKPFILKSKEVILVEGQPDIWRLYEAGFYNSLGLLGGYLTKNRVSTLKKLGVKSIIMVMDNDEAGKKHEEYISKLFNRNDLYETFEVTKKEISQKDIGDMSVSEVRKLFYD